MADNLADNLQFDFRASSLMFRRFTLTDSTEGTDTRVCSEHLALGTH